MTKVPVSLTPEEEAALVAQAKAQGVSVDSLLRKAILQFISASAETAQLRPQLTEEEFDRAFDEIADMIPDGIPLLSDEALRRESISTREDEWNQDRR